LTTRVDGLPFLNFYYFLIFLVICIFVGLCSCLFNTRQPRSVFSLFKSRAFYINIVLVARAEKKGVLEEKKF